MASKNERIEKLELKVADLKIEVKYLNQFRLRRWAFETALLKHLGLVSRTVPAQPETFLFIPVEEADKEEDS